MNLPKIVISAWLLVHSKKQPALAMNHEPITLERKLASSAYNQLGFAPIALVVLLLFGIAAGTLLIQNRTTFLPQAAEGDWNWPFRCDEVDANNASAQSALNYASECHLLQYPKFDHCDIANKSDGQVTQNPNKPSCDSFTQNFNVTYYCRWSAQCPAPAAPATGNPIVSRSCTNNVASNTRADGTTKTENCKQSGTYCREFSNDDNELVAICGIPANDAECKKAYGNNYILDKSTGHLCAPADQARAPVAPARTGPEIQAKKCNLVCPASSTGCFEIEGKQRCVFPAADPLSCPAGETTYCQAPPDVRDGCEVAQAVLVNGPTKNDIKFTRCTAPKAGAPAANPGGASPTKGTPPVAPTVRSGTANPAGAPGAQPAAVTPGAAATTPRIVNCAQDVNGKEIPCYLMGVFNDAQTLASTELGATIASERYTQYEEIMKRITGKLSVEIREIAEAKLKAAQAAAAACLAR